jgi:transposase
MGYATNHWQALTRFLDDGRLPLDNNAAERALRPIAVGRNYPRPMIRQGFVATRCETQSQRGL